MKKIFKVFLLTIVMMTLFLAAQPVSAKTAEPSARIGTKKYSSFASAVKNVQKGQTIVLLKNVFVKGFTISNQKFTVNLNNHRITLKTSINIQNESVINFKNGTLVQPKIGAIDSKERAETYKAFNISGSSKVNFNNCTLKRGKNTSHNYMEIYGNAKVSLTKVTVNSSPQNLGSSGFILINEASLTINSGNYVSKDFGFVNCGKGKVTVKGGTFSGCAFNIYGFNPDKSKMLITGGKFSAGNGQYNQEYGIIRNGSFSVVTIKGGTLINRNGPVFENRSAEDLRMDNAVLRILGGTITEK